MRLPIAILSVDPLEFDRFIGVLINNNIVEIAMSDGAKRIWFKETGALGSTIEESPVLLVRAPEKITNFLWKVGCIEIRQESIKNKWPKYHKVVLEIMKAIKSLNHIWPLKNGGNWEYYLRGSIRNYCSNVYGLPSGISSLENNQHFVNHSDNDFVIQKELRSLKLIGLCDA